MAIRHVTLSLSDLLQKSNVSPLRRGFETAAGPLILHSFCPPALVASLKAERAFHAFAHIPQREHQLLLEIAERPDCALTLAYTPADAWWQGVANTYELAIEVSAHWRRLGVARQLLSLALEFDAVEAMILVALGLSWHWDLKGSGLTPFRSRSLLAHILEPSHFFECLTDEPNVGLDPANILLVRVGKRVEREVMDQLFQRLRFF